MRYIRKKCFGLYAKCVVFCFVIIYMCFTLLHVSQYNTNQNIPIVYQDDLQEDVPITREKVSGSY